MASESTENYLATIFRLTREGTRASTKDIARGLGLSAPSVSEMVSRLAQKGYLEYESRNGVSLTDEGRAIALQVLRKHRLVETFLVRALDYGLHEVDDEACRLEHAVSERMADAMEAFLGYPTTDPHGHPIPDKEGQLPARELSSLADVAPGQSVEVAEVDDRDAQQLSYLLELGLVPGARIGVIDVAAIDGVLLLQVDERQIPLAQRVARAVGVTRLV